MPTPAKPFVIHHIEGRRSERVAWLCEELGLPYELKYVPGDLFGSLDALGRAHVMRMAPVFEDEPVTLVESGAILEYILLRYGEGRFRPAEGAPEFVDYLQWLHFAEGSGMFRAMIEAMIFRLAGENPPDDLKFVYVGASRRVLDFAEATLAERPYFAGAEFSAADIMMHFPLRMAPLAMTHNTTQGAIFRDDRSGLSGHPNVNAFLDRMNARPAFQRAMAATMPSGPPPM